MGPFAAGVSVMIATFVIVVILVGAGVGALSWWSERGLVRGGLASMGVCVLLALLLMGPFGLATPLLFGLPPLGCAFLITYLTARRLRARGLHPIWATGVALASVLVAGALYVLSFRLGLVLPTLLAAVVGLSLVVRVARTRSQAPALPSAPPAPERR